jgi:hypothetical protein
MPIADPEWQASGEPVWSRDGTRLAVTCRPKEGESHLRRGATGPSRIIWASTDGEETGSIRGASVVGWRGEQALLAVVRGFIVRTGTGFGRLVVLGLDGSLQHVLREPEALLHNAQVSPDARWVAVVGWHGEDAWDVYLHDIESGTTAKVTEAPLSGDPEVGWAAEGELWVAVEGDAGMLINAHDHSTRPAASRPKLAGDHGGQLRFECRRGDLYKRTEVKQAGGPTLVVFERCTFCNVQAQFAPTPDFGGGN